MKTDRNTHHAEQRIRNLARQLRRDVETVIEPKAQVLLEKSAEVLGGLIESFEKYRMRRDRERQHETGTESHHRRGPRRKPTATKSRRPT